MVITIDGPAASGKSTVGRMLAEQLGFYYINSGLLFRALAYLLIQHRLYNEEALQNPKKKDIAIFFDPERFYYRYDHGKEIVLFDGCDITPKLKSSFLDKATSLLSTNDVVREAIRAIQHDLEKKYNLVVEGRDSGSVVFPHAAIKFFLTASAEKRAERWQHLQQQRGNDVSLHEAIRIINERDKRDKERKIAPLCIPDNATVIDNSDLTIKQTVQKMVHVYQQKKEGA